MTIYYYVSWYLKVDVKSDDHNIIRIIKMTFILRGLPGTMIFDDVSLPTICHFLSKKGSSTVFFKKKMEAFRLVQPQS